MEKEMVTVISTVNGVVGIYLPDLRFKKEWTRKEQKQKIDKELLQDICMTQDQSICLELVCYI